MQSFYDPEPGAESPQTVRMVVEIPNYPGDYGFIPGTVAEDREPLDILYLATIAVPGRDPRCANIRQVGDIEPHIGRELQYRFQIYKDLEGRAMETLSWGKQEEAYRIINESRSRYSQVLIPESTASR